MDLKTQIRLARESKGWSQEQLGKKMSPPVSKQAVMYWEDGLYTPRPAKLKRLEQVLETRFDVTGSAHIEGTARLPAGVNAEHVELALCLSRLPMPERKALAVLIKIAAARAEGKPMKPFFDIEGHQPARAGRKKFLTVQENEKADRSPPAKSSPRGNRGS